MIRVDNAIIMAAGLSSRFLPLSLEKPKSLWSVKGEVLIERQIRQLQEAGIKDITIVVGYMAEQFSYLKEQFQVELVENKDYYRYNNLSSLVRVKDRLRNTYICSSDNYFLENPFSSHEPFAYYPVVKNPNEAGEYYVKWDELGKINQVRIGQGDYAMIGHVFFDEEFSKRFLRIIEKRYEETSVKENLWEHLYMQHLDELFLNIKKVSSEKFKEFDSLEDLQSFDSDYMETEKSDVLNIIAKELNTSVSSIRNIKVLEGGLTNAIFTFEINGDKYVYRHPGVGTETYINRVSEYHAHMLAKQHGFDPSLYWMDQSGNKIAHYIEDYRYFDYENKEDVQQVLKMMRDLHSLDVRIGYEFEIEKEIHNFLNEIEDYGQEIYPDLLILRDKVLGLLQELDYKNAHKTLCHNDVYPTNVLITKDQTYLIDWEFAADTHPALDLATFIVCSPYNLEEVDKALKLYLAYQPAEKESIEFYRYFAVSAFYWLLWALFQESNGQSTGEFLEKYYQYCILFLNNI